MAPSPDNNINLTNSPAIQELGIGDYGNNGIFIMKLRFKDSDYKRVQSAVTGNNDFNWVGGQKLQAHYQPPNYLVRIFFKQKPTRTIGSTDQLWVSYNSFNNTDYLRFDDNGQSNWNTTQIGMGLTPYRYYFNIHNGTWDHGHIGQSDYFSNDQVTVYFDKYGRASHSPNSRSDVRKQAVRRYYPTTNAGLMMEKWISSYPFYNSFDYGGYLVCVIRNAIDNNAYNVNNQTPISSYSSRMSCAYMHRVPPAPILSFNSSTDVVSFTFSNYGSNNITWQGVPYISDRYNYPPNFEVTTTGSFNSGSYRSYGGSISRNDINWADNVTTSSTLSNIRSYVNQYDKTISVRGAFEYDWSYYNNRSSGNFVLAYSHENFSDSTNWNKVFSLSYSNYYNYSGVNTSFDTGNILNNGQRIYFQTTSNTFSFDSLYSSISLNTEIVNINNQYLFRSSWIENQPNALTNNVLNDKYTLRLYKKSTTSTSTDMSYKYRLGATNNYVYTGPNNTGLSVSNNWDGSYYMNIYTDKNGNIWYGSQPTSGFTGWTQDEIEGAYLMVLQRNFTATPTSGINIALQACYAINFFRTPYLSYSIDTSNGNSIYSMNNGVFYADSSNNWTIERLFNNETYRLFSAVTNYLQVTTDELKDEYFQFNLYNHMSFTMQNTNSVYISGCVQRSPYGDMCPPIAYSTMFYPPFYDSSYNLITTYPGSDSTNSITLDLQNSPFMIEGRGDTLYIYASSIDNPNGWSRTFLPNASVSLYTIEDHPLNRSFRFTMQSIYSYISGDVYIADYWLRPYVNPDTIYIVGPFYDSSYNQIYSRGGRYQPNGWSRTNLDLTKRLRLTVINGNTFQLFGTPTDQTGDNYNTTIEANENIYFYIDKRVEFTMDSSTYGDINGNVIANNIESVPNSSNPGYFNIFPPFYDLSGNLVTTYPGIGTTATPGEIVDVTLDLTRRIYISRSNNIYSANCYISGSNNTATFRKGDTISFIRSNFRINRNKTAGLIKNEIINKFSVGDYFADNLGTYGYYNVYDFSGENQTISTFVVTNLSSTITNQSSTFTNQPLAITNELTITNQNSTTSQTNGFLIFPDPIDLNTEIVQIGTEYLFHSYWEEKDYLLPYLNDYLTDASYALRLYYKDPKTTGTVEETYLAGNNVENYKFINTSNTGLTILPNWNTTSPYTMNIYTDKAGNVFYNSPPANDTQFEGWKHYEIENAWLMVLQRNFTNSINDPILLENQACYAINIYDDSIHLDYSFDSNGKITGYTPTGKLVYPEAKNYWKIDHLIKDQSYNLNTNDISINLPNVTTSDFTALTSKISEYYADEKQYHTLSFKRQSQSGILDGLVNGFDLDGVNYNVGSYATPTQINHLFRGFHPPFYDTSGNLLTDISGIIAGTNQLVDIDLTKFLQLYQYGNGECISLRATPKENTGTNNVGTLLYDASVTLLMDKLTGTPKIETISFTMDNSVRGKVDGSYTLNGGLYPASEVLLRLKYFYAPFMDAYGRLITEISGVMISDGTPVDIDLKKNFSFYNLGGSVGFRAIPVGSDSPDATFELGKTYSFQFYEAKRIFFNKAPYSSGTWTTVIQMKLMNDSSSNIVQIPYTYDYKFTIIPPIFDNYGNYLETYEGHDSQNNTVKVDMTKQVVFQHKNGFIYVDCFDTSGGVCSFKQTSEITFIIHGGLYGGPGIIYDKLVNETNLNVGSTFTEYLDGYNYHTITNISGGDQTFNVEQQALSLIYPQPIVFNTEIQQIGSEYLFHSYWEDPYSNFLTENQTLSPYSLRLYQKNPSSTGNVEKTYLDGPVKEYEISSLTIETYNNRTFKQVDISFVTGDIFNSKNLGLLSNIFPNMYFYYDGVAYDSGNPLIYDVEFFIYPPFYDLSNNLILTYEGQYYDQPPTSVLIDMTKRIKVQDQPFTNALSVYGTSVGQTIDLFDVCFKVNSAIKFKSGSIYDYRFNFQMSGGNYSQLSYGTQNFIINEIGYGYNDFEEILAYPPFYISDVLTTSIEGIDINDNPVTIDMTVPIKFYTNGIYVYVLASSNASFNASFKKSQSYQIACSKISVKTGLDVSNNWKTIAPYTMDIYTDKLGNVFYNSPPANDTLFEGWQQYEIEDAWFMVLQQNFTNSNYTNLWVQNQACYAIDIPDPSLTRINDVNGFMVQLDTNRTYYDTSNNWSVYEYDTTNTVQLPLLLHNSKPLRTEVNTAYPLRVGPGSITNYIINYLNVGSSFAQEINGINYLITSISGEDQTPYDASSNSVDIYDPQQSNDSAYNLSKVKYTFNTYDVSKVYFDIWFEDPDDTMLRPEAFDINIFKKTKGTGTALSQWYPDGQVSPYIWQDDNNRGITISKVDVPTELEKYKIDASGNVLKYGQGTPADLSGSFETGGYIVTFRRNFYKGTTTEPNAKEPFYTLNSQYVHVSPSQETDRYSLSILDSSNLLLEYNAGNDSLDITVPIYDSYAQDCSTIDIGFDFYLNFENDLFTPSWQPNSYYTVTDNFATVNFPFIYTDYYGLGDGYFLFEVSYNWFAPSQMSLPIGEIGGIYPTIYSADINPDLSNVDAPLTVIKEGFVEQVRPNTGITNTVLRNLPVDSSFARLNEVQELQAAFIGSDTTRMLAIKWREPNVDNLNNDYTGYPYALRLYKKKKDGQTANDQWYDRDASGTAGVYPYRWVPDYFNPNPNNYTYDGVEISANFFPQITTGNYLYFFADASGTVYYNDYPDDLELQNVHPFTEPGGYILIVQRHYIDSEGSPVFTTFGQYLNFIPISSTNPWPLEDTEYPIITSNPNPYSSFEPFVDGGAQNLQFHWTLEIPNINYNEIIQGEDFSGIDVEKIQDTFRNRGKEAFLTSYVTYNFGLKTRPFVERYPLLRINGDPYYTTPSQQYTTNLCSTVTPLDPPEWPRFRPECLDATSEEREAYQMRRKAETLFHVQNRDDMRTNRKNWFSFVAKGYNQKHQTYATQTDKYTNPNTKNYPVVGGGAGLTLPADCPKKALTAPSYSSDVPGATVPLTYDPNVPLINYKVFRTYTNSETEYTEKDKN